VSKSNAQSQSEASLAQLFVPIMELPQNPNHQFPENVATIMSDLPTTQEVLLRSGRTDSGTHSVVTTSGTTMMVLQLSVKCLVTTTVTDITPDRHLRLTPLILENVVQENH
jgi:hypothetical protein